MHRKVRAIHEEFTEFQCRRDKVNFDQLNNCSQSKHLVAYDPKRRKKRGAKNE